MRFHPESPRSWDLEPEVAATWNHLSQDALEQLAAGLASSPFGDISTLADALDRRDRTAPPQPCPPHEAARRAARFVALLTAGWPRSPMRRRGEGSGGDGRLRPRGLALRDLLA
jgi:hypothetical protein